MARQSRSSGSSALRTLVPIAMGVGYYFYLRPLMLKAGTLPGEAERRLPGDDVIAIPNFQGTRATDIDAPPEAVWPWIAQMGRDYTGYYGIDNLTNQGIPSAAYLRTDLPAPVKGMPLNNGYRILDVEAERLLLYGAFDLPTPLNNPMEVTVLLLLERRHDGGTRLLIRKRGYTYGLFGTYYNLIYEVMDYLEAVAQLENIRQRAETMAQLRAPIKI